MPVNDTHGAFTFSDSQTEKAQKRINLFYAPEALFFCKLL